MSIPQRIKDLANKVRNEIYGKDVRESIAQSMEVTGETAEEAKVRSVEQTDRVDTLITENPQPSEVVDARLGYNTLRDKLNSTDQQLAETNHNIEDYFLNVKYPPRPFLPLLLDDETDETDEFQSLLDYLESKGGGTLYIPEGVLIQTVNFIPDNVRLKGAGVGLTTIKLKDNYCDVPRKMAGLYTKKNVDYYEILDLTYNGNATNNIAFFGSEETNEYNAHGIVNRYYDPTQDMAVSEISDDPSYYAQNFYYNNVHVKNVIRNNMLLTGRNEENGTLGTVLLENSYLDHLIYESNNNAKFSYLNVTTKGFWYGSAIVASNGKFGHVKNIEPLNNPLNDKNLNSYIQIRNFDVNGVITKPYFQHLDLDLLFQEMGYIVIEHGNNNDRRYQIDGLTINQKDTVRIGRYDVPLSIVYTNKTKNGIIENIEVNAYADINLATVVDGSENLTMDGVHINNLYTGANRNNGSILVLRNNTGLPYKDINIKNVSIDGKAQEVLYFESASGVDIAMIDGILLDNIRGQSDGTNNMFNVASFMDYFDGEGIKMTNSKLNGYSDINMSASFRDKFDVKIEGSILNDRKSDQVIVTAFSVGETEKVLPFLYLAGVPRTIVARNRHIGRNVPSIAVSNLEMTLTLEEPAEKYQEIHVMTKF